MSKRCPICNSKMEGDYCPYCGIESPEEESNNNKGEDEQ